MASGVCAKFCECPVLMALLVPWLGIGLAGEDTPALQDSSGPLRGAGRGAVAASTCARTRIRPCRGVRDELPISALLIR